MMMNRFYDSFNKLDR